MTCTITQADLGPLFAAVDPLLADESIEQAVIVVLGDETGQAAAEAAYRACGVDPCNQIKLLAQHLLSSTPGTGVSGKKVTSERVGDVAVTYANSSTSTSAFGDTPYGALYQLGLSRFEKCRAKRRTLPFAVGTTYATDREV